MGKEKPHTIQKVLLHLREDIINAVTLNQRLRALHSYTVFVHAIACHIQSGKFAHLNDFLLSDITHTLLYLLYENRMSPGMVDVCIGCLRYSLYRYFES